MSSDPYDPKTFRPQDGLGWLIGSVRKAIIEKTEERLAPLDISAAQWIVILWMSDRPSMTQGELCRALNYDPGAMTRLVDRLAAKGFVQRVRLEDDRRSVNLELTAAGRALYPPIIDALVAVYNNLLRGFTAPELQALEGFLRRILANA
jgi:DNA-binding MarR family transcriptional regulator